jgi:hypothetical protein
MNYDELHADGCLKHLPMRAWLKPTGVATRFASPGWLVEDQWKGAGEKPILVGVTLKLLKLDGVVCCVVQGRAIALGDGDPTDEDERAIVYLLNPADGDVWQAIDSWMKAGYIVARVDLRSTHGTSVSDTDLAVLEARAVEGEELESDMLAASLRSSSRPVNSKPKWRSSLTSRCPSIAPLSRRR